MSLIVFEPLLIDPLPTETPTETVQRPTPGLARGHWEAPPWVFYAVIAAAVLGGLTWGLTALRARQPKNKRTSR
ncbi:MAG TPA: hypothetical protein VK762_10970 [Polyangiaceae bacterium]|jgi:hypothetical protein|nr:hypothetical protein [Polyangiaceae bacterium]